MSAPNIIVDRYEIVRSLGEASQRTLFLARDRSRNGLPVAFKIFRRADMERGLAFLRECETLHQLRHPNIARLEDWGETEEGYFHVTEFVEGRDIVREARARDWKAVFQLIVQSAWALGEIHERGILHRDLKPESFLVGRVLQKNQETATERLRLKLTDFGLALAPNERPGVPTASLPYIAPEILSGQSSDHRADLYSFGVVLYHLALGKLPHLPNGSFADYLQALSEGHLDLEVLRGTETPRGILECIRRLVLPNPERRLRSAAEMIRCLNHYEHQHFPLSTPRPSTQSSTETLEHPDSKGSSGATPEHILKNLLELSRSGKKTEALAFAEPLLPQVYQWRNPALVADFLAAFLYLLAESGRVAEAQDLLSVLYEHPALKAQPNLEYFLTGAYLAFRQGRRREARALLEKTPEALLRKAPAAKRARYENYLALCAQAERNFAQAALHYERASEHAHEAKRRDQEASFSANAAGLYFELNRWAKAYLLYQSALGLARELGNRSLEASILHHLGKLYLDFGRWHEAEGALIRSLDLARQLGMKSLIAHNLYLMTVAEEERGNPEKAEDYLNQAMRHAESLGEPEILLQIQLARAHHEADRGHRSEAEAALAKLRQSAETEGLPNFLLQGEWLRAKMAIGQGRYAETWIATTLESVREEAAGHAIHHWLWQVHIDLGDLERLQGRFDEAAASYQRAEEVLNELLQEVPESYRESFFRDRKKDRLRRGRMALESSQKHPGEETTAKDIPMPPVEEPGLAGVSFARWTEVNRRILKKHRTQPLLEEILDCAISLTDAERGYIILSEQDTLEVRAFRNLDPQSLESAGMSFSRGIAHEVLRQGVSQAILDALNDARFNSPPTVEASPLRSLLCVPISAGVRARGLIYLDNRLRPGVFTAEHLPMLEALAAQGSLALEHAMLHETNERLIQELTQSKALVEKLNAALERDLEATRGDLESVQEGLRLQNQDLSLKYKYDNILGESPTLKEALKRLDKAVDSHLGLFISGEVGTGKGLFAQAIHFNGPRKDKPFLRQNCAAMPENLLEGELFGYARGAFPGTDRQQPGLFEAAQGGTVFLDEIEQLSGALQAELLRVMQEGSVRRLGENQFRRVDVRIICASHQDLEEWVQAKKFRRDLYFRLQALKLELPPLRERREDIPVLLDHFLMQFRKDSGQAPLKPEAATLQALMDYDWPGNVRELQSEARRLAILAADRDLISPEQLSPHILETKGVDLNDLYLGGLDPQIEDLEKKAILHALDKVRGNKVQAAKLLKISRRTLYLKMRAFQIDRRHGKTASLSIDKMDNK